MANSEKLFSDFPAVTAQDWLAKIEVDLKGADFEKRLVWRTNEGFKVKPFYCKEDVEGLSTLNALPGEYPYLRGTRKDNSWRVRQNIVVSDFAEANAKALDVLNKGIDSLGFKIQGDDVNAGNIATLLQGICPECVELNFSTCQKRSIELARILVDYFKSTGCDLSKVTGSIDFDPINRMLIKGLDVTGLIALGKDMIEILSALPSFKAIEVNALSLNNAGSYIYQELGYALAWGVEYIDRMVAAGVDAKTAAGSMKFDFGISSNYFMEIAKFRAARLLWAKIVSSYDSSCGDAAKMSVHAETTSHNLTMFDSYVNLLRTQTEAMSAALGGVDSLAVTPFDKAYKDSDDFSERLARNQQLLLKEESHFDKVVDPAAGSYYIEHLTAAIAEQAWKLFLEIDALGGFVKAVKSSQVQDAVNKSNADRHLAVAGRKEILLGTNQYPNFTERPDGKRPLSKSSSCSSHDHQAQFSKLNFDRAASEFEALRLQTEDSGKRPKAFMLTIGNLAMRQARAQFSCNFFACAGYEVIDNLGFETVEAGVAAAVEANADVVVLCSSDDEYATYAVPAYKALAGRAVFVVAGAPACKDELKAEGIENFIHARANVLETLKEFNAKLGIK